MNARDIMLEQLAAVRGSQDGPALKFLGHEHAPQNLIRSRAPDPPP